jgi:hypothetical protein
LFSEEPEADKYNPHPLTLFNSHFNIIFASMSLSSEWTLPSGFHNKHLYAYVNKRGRTHIQTELEKNVFGKPVSP